jgi:hypothetical protein
VKAHAAARPCDPAARRPMDGSLWSMVQDGEIARIGPGDERVPNMR